jgi:CobQ-like glutamine amidotransferase family enzyme
MRTIRIAHLYPKLLNIYGDIGNIITLKKRCEWRGIKVQIDEINVGDEIGEHDIYFIGGGQDLQQIEVSKELQKHKDFLISERDRGAVFLGICGGYQLFGHYYQPHQGEKLLGISLLDAYTVAGSKRFIGNVTVKTDLVEPNTLVGFENHSGLTYLSGDTKPIGNIVVGNGNNGSDGSEGARYKNVFGTYLHGSFLPKNPHFTDYLIELATGDKLEPLDDKIELNTHKSLIRKSY